MYTSYTKIIYIYIHVCEKSIKPIQIIFCPGNSSRTTQYIYLYVYVYVYIYINIYIYIIYISINFVSFILIVLWVVVAGGCGC